MEKFILSFDNFKKSKKLSVKDEPFDFSIDGGVVKSSDIKVSFEANRYCDVVNVVGAVTGIMSFECSRCLNVFDKSVNIKFEYSFGKEEHDFDLADKIKEDIILDMPMKPLCRQDCRGICPVCGADRNLKNCFCERKAENEFVSEKWSKIKNLNLNISGGKNAKSKKKT